MAEKPFVGITGTSWGLGAAIAKAVPDNYAILDINRDGSPGLPHAEFMTKIIDTVIQRDPAVFINNVYGGSGGVLGVDPNPQLTVFRRILNLWKGKPSKTIINVCSIAGYYARTPTMTGSEEYRQNKLALQIASEQATLDCENVRCRVTAFSPGYIRTRRTDGDKHKEFVMMEDSEVAQYVWWLIGQPAHLRIPHFALFAVNAEGMNRTS